MRAIEFETEYKNGLIKIPDEYQILPDSHLKVIVLYDEIKCKNNSDYFKQLSKEYCEVMESDLDINKIYQERKDREARNVLFD